MTKNLACASFLLLVSATAAADPGYYLVSTYENEGEKSVDFRYWTVKFPGSSVVTWPELGFGYGVTKRWYTEVFASYIQTANGGTGLSTLNWQNDYLLTQGQYQFDLALHTNLTINHGNDGHTLEFGPVMQTDIGRTQLNLNVFLERTYQTEVANRMQMKYQWQAKYRWRPALHFGLQGFGELGDWDHWAAHKDQSHRIGPMISGTLPIGGVQAVKYQAAYLAGSVYGSNGKMFSMRLQYVF